MSRRNVKATIATTKIAHAVRSAVIQPFEADDVSSGVVASERIGVTSAGAAPISAATATLCETACESDWCKTPATNAAQSDTNVISTSIRLTRAATESGRDVLSGRIEEMLTGQTWELRRDTLRWRV